MPSVSVVIIAKNEESRIEACLQSVSWAQEIIVIDSQSTDRTIDKARQYTSRIYSRPFDNFRDQKNYGMSLAAGDWILSIDADEVVSEELKSSILEAVNKASSWNGFYVTRSNFIFGEQFRYGGQGSEHILRLFRRGTGKFERPIHETLVVDGPVGNLNGILFHYTIATIKDYRRRLEQYTDFEAEWMAARGTRFSLTQLLVVPVARFFYFYFFRLGFLDGPKAFLYHMLSSYYYFLKYRKLFALERASKKENRHAGCRRDTSLPQEH